MCVCSLYYFQMAFLYRKTPSVKSRSSNTRFYVFYKISVLCFYSWNYDFYIN